METKTLEKTIEEIIGDPKEIDADLQRYRKDAQLLSSPRMNLIGRYPKRWVAIYQGEVKASARSMKQVLKKIEEMGLPREKTIVRYIARKHRRMILASC